jgi:hypothetical protein
LGVFLERGAAGNIWIQEVAGNTRVEEKCAMRSFMICTVQFYHGEEFDDDQEAGHVKHIQSFSW